MNYKTFILVIGLAFMLQGVRGQELNQQTHDETRGEEILIGYCDRDGLETGIMHEVFQNYYHSYEADYEIVHMFHDLIREVDITIVFGSWCRDSHVHLPHLFKILDLINYPYERLTIIAVDYSKKAPEIDLNEFEIELVPTFIFYSEGRELGRITESPGVNLESDILRIMNPGDE